MCECECECVLCLFVWLCVRVGFVSVWKCGALVHGITHTHTQHTHIHTQICMYVSANWLQIYGHTCWGLVLRDQAAHHAQRTKREHEWP
jgi:hypothetical protein